MEETAPLSGEQKMNYVVVDGHNDQGNLTFRVSNFRSAIIHYLAAINLDDRNAIYYANFAAAYNAVKEYENGLKMVLAGRKEDPMLVKSVYTQAQVLYGLGRLRDALSVYEQVFQIQWQMRESCNLQAQQIQHAQQAPEAQHQVLHHLQQQLEQQARMGASPEQMQQLYQQAEQLLQTQELNQQLATAHQQEQQHAQQAQEAQEALDCAMEYTEEWN